MSTPPPRSTSLCLTVLVIDCQTQATYKERTTLGGFLTFILAILVSILVWTELSEYLYGEADYAFSVDGGVSRDLQLNFDSTIATPCHCASPFHLSQLERFRLNTRELGTHLDLTVDVRDAVGDRMHISDEFKKDGVGFPPFSSISGQKNVGLRNSRTMKLRPRLRLDNRNAYKIYMVR